jgi:hypothetical protein
MKLTKEEMWNMADSVATAMVQKGYCLSDLDDIDKFEMGKKFDMRITEMPTTISQFDGKDYEEDDCFDYFKTLVKFKLAGKINANISTDISD